MERPPPSGFLRRLLVFAVLFEAATSLALIGLPGAACWLVFGASSDGAGQAMARLAGVALAAFAVSCWPADLQVGGARWPQRGMLAYNALAAILLLSIGAAGQTVGWLLWPAGVFHAVMTVLLAAAMFWKTLSGR
jgi:hypothetical protein